jgi:hypothetical protein
VGVSPRLEWRRERTSFLTRGSGTHRGSEEDLIQFKSVSGKRYTYLDHGLSDSVYRGYT